VQRYLRIVRRKQLEESADFPKNLSVDVLEDLHDHQHVWQEPRDGGQSVPRPLHPPDVDENVQRGGDHLHRGGRPVAGLHEAHQLDQGPVAPVHSHLQAAVLREARRHLQGLHCADELSHVLVCEDEIDGLSGSRPQPNMKEVIA